MQNRKTVAIIGAGIVGVATALWLQRDGHSVILVDRVGPAGGASYGNAGLLASAATVPVPVPGLWKRAPRMLLDPREPLFLKWAYLPKLAPWLVRYLSHATAAAVRKRAAAQLPLIGESLSDHQALSEGTPAARYVHDCDYIYGYPDRAAYEADAFTWQVRREQGFTWELLDTAAFEAYDPAYRGAIGCAARLPGHGRISDPGSYVKSLAAQAEADGARLVQAEIEQIVVEHGRVSGVRAGGDLLSCDAVVVAGGAWSTKLASSLGLKVPMEIERGYHIELWEPSVMPRAPVMVAAGKFVANPMEGRLRLAGIVEYGGLDAGPSRAPFALLRRNIRKAIPDLEWKSCTEWMGHRPVVADSLPVIGEVPGCAGVFVGFGHDHLGLTAGPKTGRLLAQLIAGRRPNVDLTPYAPGRFS
ncbi:NAD(P)/FAD-dependent oxidoreductase [Roseovarius aestuariivivens]|uniref:NAD(P)/FAD-dependent oxidoreductase n=1 Tax=Roseovarius aestuariivivens TaxID=1888910 RepID=UPI001080E10B|nr:FAD-binding oxidoreductase [Roseovarius aestuariivivens]